MKFCCQWISVSVNTSVQFHTSQLLRDLGVGLGLDQCEDTITLTLVPAYNELNYNDQIYVTAAGWRAGNTRLNFVRPGSDLVGARAGPLRQPGLLW